MNEILTSAAVAAIAILLVWATNRLLGRRAQGRNILPPLDASRIVTRALMRKNTADTADPVLDQPMPVLDGQEPHYAIHVENAGDPATYCSCHGFKLTDGERILIWPVEALLCKQTYGQLGDNQ